MQKFGIVIVAGLFLLLGMYVGNGLHSSVVKAQDGVKSVGTLYDYKVVIVRSLDTQLEGTVSELTKDNWEIVAVVNDVSIPGGGFSVRNGSSGNLSIKTAAHLILKREKR